MLRTGRRWPHAQRPRRIALLDDENVTASTGELVWRVMVIDDEPDVNRATTFALSGVKILGRPIEFLHAHSAGEAFDLLTREHNIAVILLDVVMESDDAGLELVKTIRQQLKLNERLMGSPESLDPMQILALFRDRVAVKDDSMVMTATLGLTNQLSGNILARDAMKDAKITLKRAKKTRLGGIVMFSSEMGSDIRERMRLLQNLRQAFESERLFIVYQPQFNLASGARVGSEALIRWRNEDGSFVPPDRFIALAEASGMIVAIGDWVLRMACHELVRIQCLGYSELRMPANVSQVQFRHPELLEKRSAALLDTGIKSKYLELEITESVAMEDADFMLETLHMVRDMGISIVIDDFGTGYSSLSQELSGEHIASMVIELGRNLNLTVIAEGIEEERQAEILLALGCHEGQGYLYARPLTSVELRAWL